MKHDAQPPYNLVTNADGAGPERHTRRFNRPRSHLLPAAGRLPDAVTALQMLAPVAAARAAGANALALRRRRPRKVYGQLGGLEVRLA